MKTVTIGGEIFVPVSRASEMLGYSRDYVGQLCRVGTFSCKRSGGQWFVLEKDVSSRSSHKKLAEEKKSGAEADSQGEEVVSDKVQTLHKVKVGTVRNDSIFFDGEEYVTSARAKELTGYAQDYIGELARSSAVPAKKVGNHWFVQKESVLKHKKEKDALLAHVQAESAGFSDLTPRSGGVNAPQKLNFSARYITEDLPQVPLFTVDDIQTAGSVGPAMEELSLPEGAPAEVLSTTVPRYFPQVSEGSYKVSIRKSTQAPMYGNIKNMAKNNISDRRVYIKETSKEVYTGSEYRSESERPKSKATSLYNFFKGIAFGFFILSTVLFGIYAFKTYAVFFVSQHDDIYEQVSDTLPGNTFEYRSQ